MTPADSAIVRQDRPTMYFVGVTTGQSASVRLFPRWTAAMGIAGAQLIGVDLPLHAAPERYRQVVAQIKYDPLSLGVLVTSHKVDLYDAAAGMFDELDHYAAFWREISCISKRDGRLIGRALDPITAGQALREILPTGYWGRTGAHLLCLGGGGAAAALLGYLLTRPDQADIPRRIVVVNRSGPRLEALRGMVAEMPVVAEVDYVQSDDPRENDRLMADLPEGSLVVNATGMGKDRPGSPLTDGGEFPARGIAWDLNYRGELGFLRQARAQQERRGLAVHDGWRYFVISWNEHIAEVFDRPLTDELRRTLYAIEP